MSNLSSPHKYLSSFIEATVLSVDPLRFVCSIKTINGKIFQDVRWLLPTGGFSESGFHFTPNIQDRVLISTALGYPLILGCIPRIGTYNGEIESATGASSTIDLGSSSSLEGVASVDPSKPGDFVPGDFMYTTRGGGLLAILTSGIAILKASNLSQIVLSKFEGLVRVVTRNYQRFSDASSRVSTNMRGRLYEWFGADWDITHNRQSNERYQEVYGDVAAGEVLKGVPDHDLIIPAQDTRIRKQWLRDASGNVIEVETLYNDGSLTFVVQSWNSNPTPAIVNTNTTTINNGEWENRAITGSNISHITITSTNIISSITNGTDTSSITSTPSSVVVNSTDGTNTSTATVSTTTVIVNTTDGSDTSTATIIPASVTVTSPTILIEAISAVTVQATGTVIVEASSVTVTSPSIQLGNGGTLSNLVTDTFISLFNEHTHLYSPGSGSQTATATPIPLSTSANVTTIVEAQ